MRRGREASTRGHGEVPGAPGSRPTPPGRAGQAQDADRRHRLVAPIDVEQQRRDRLHRARVDAAGRRRRRGSGGCARPAPAPARAPRRDRCTRRRRRRPDARWSFNNSALSFLKALTTRLSRQQLLDRLGRGAFRHPLDRELLVHPDQRIDDVDHDRARQSRRQRRQQLADAGEGRRDHHQIGAAHGRLVLGAAHLTRVSRRRAVVRSRAAPPRRRAAPGASRGPPARRTWRSAAPRPRPSGPVPPTIAMRPMSRSARGPGQRPLESRRRPASRRRDPFSGRLLACPPPRVTPGGGTGALWHRETRDAPHHRPQDPHRQHGRSSLRSSPLFQLRGYAASGAVTDLASGIFGLAVASASLSTCRTVFGKARGDDPG